MQGCSHGHPCWHSRAQGQAFLTPRVCLGIRMRTLIADDADRVDFFVAEANRALTRFCSRLRPHISSSSCKRRAAVGPTARDCSKPWKSSSVSERDTRSTVRSAESFTMVERSSR
jgi:hypothetical protein